MDCQLHHGGPTNPVTLDRPAVARGALADLGHGEVVVRVGIVFPDVEAVDRVDDGGVVEDDAHTPLGG